MTLAIGAKYPWGELNKLLPPNSEQPEAIILVCDSRISKKLPCGYVPHLDVGTKLFKLGRDTGAVYAGMSRIGEKCLDELRWKLSRQRIPNSQQSRELAKETFQDVYKHCLAIERLKPDETPLYILIGACDKRGRAELYRFSHAANFNPEPISGLKALGCPGTISRFNNLFNNELEKQVENELALRRRHPQIPIATLVPAPIKADHIAILMAASLNNLIESGFDETVGGMVQCAVITAKGVSLPKISYTPKLTNKSPQWTRITARPEELRTLTGTFGFYNLSD